MISKRCEMVRSNSLQGNSTRHRLLRHAAFAVAVSVAAACGGTTEPPPNNGPFAIARFEGIPTDTTLEVLDDVTIPIRAIDTKGNVVADIASLVTATSAAPAVLGASAVTGASTTIAGNAYGTTVLAITASNANVPGAQPVTATLNVVVRPRALVLEFPEQSGHVEIYGVADDRSVGGAAYARKNDGGPIAWSYTPGNGSHLLAPLSGDRMPSQVRGVAGDGIMVGYSASRKTRWSPSGTPSDLGPPGIATGVNRSGAVLYYAPTNIPGGQQNQPFYRAPNGDITALGAMGGREAIGWDLAEDGGVTGTVLTDAGGSAFYWTPQAGMTLVPMASNFVVGNGIATAGRVVGTINYGPQGVNLKGFYWSQAEGVTELKGFGTDSFVSAEDINDQGVVVGWSMNAPPNARSRGFVWTKAGGYVDLTGKLPRPTRAFAISNSGVVAGTMETVAAGPFGPGEQPVIWILKRP